jgi:hypothetical protein
MTRAFVIPRDTEANARMFSGSVSSAEFLNGWFRDLGIDNRVSIHRDGPDVVRTTVETHTGSLVLNEGDWLVLTPDLKVIKYTEEELKMNYRIFTGHEGT